MTIGSPGSRAGCFCTCSGSLTAQGSAAPHVFGTSDVAFHFLLRCRHPGVGYFRGSMAGLHMPLSTLQGCPREEGRYVVPSEYVLRNVLIRVTPAHLDQSLQRWNEVYGAGDESLAIDGKTMCNALDEQGQQTHVMSVVGHQSKTCYTQKKWAPCQ